MLLGLFVAAAVAAPNPPAPAPAPSQAGAAKPAEEPSATPVGAPIRRAVFQRRLEPTEVRGLDAVWEVHADGRQRSCRRVNHFATGEQLHIDGCPAVNRGFIEAATAYLKLPVGEVLTVRLENQFLVKPGDSWRAHTGRGEVLARAEATYELNEDQSVLSCTLGPATAKFEWRMQPCFRNSFKGQLPPDIRSVRLAVQWVVVRGSDSERPTAFPRLVLGDQVVPPRASELRPAPPPPAPPPPRRKGVVAARAQANLASYISDDDYPAEAIREEQQGTTAFRLTVDRTGQVSACQVFASSGSAVLDETTCRLLQSRARFTPARDRRGRAVEDEVVGRIMWMLPEPFDEVRMRVPDLQVVTFRIRKDGSITDCRGESRNDKETTVREGAECPALTTPATAIAAIRSQSAVPEPQVRTELRLLRRADEPWPQYKDPGQKQLARVDARLTVEADGRVTDCRVLESTSIIGPPPSPCNATGLLLVEARGMTLPGEVRVSQVTLLEGEPAAAK